MRAQNIRLYLHSLSVICTVLLILALGGIGFGQGFMVQPMQIEISLAPGETYREEIVVTNLSEKDVQIQITKNDFAMKQDGTLEILKPGTSSLSLAGWLSLPSEELVVKAGRTESISLSITRPEDSSPKAYWGYLFVQNIEPITTKGNIGVKFRFAIRILQIDPILQQRGIVTAMQVELKEAEEGNSRTAVVFTTLANTCLNILKADVHFEIRDMTGTTVATHELKDRVVLPEHERRRTFSAEFPADDWPPGQYIALAIIDYGGETLSGGQWPFEIPEEE